jgi:hypothetical protein
VFNVHCIASSLLLPSFIYAREEELVNCQKCEGRNHTYVSKIGYNYQIDQEAEYDERCEQLGVTTVYVQDYKRD